MLIRRVGERWTGKGPRSNCGGRDEEPEAGVTKRPSQAQAAPIAPLPLRRAASPARRAGASEAKRWFTRQPLTQQAPRDAPAASAHHCGRGAILCPMNGVAGIRGGAAVKKR